MCTATERCSRFTDTISLLDPFSATRMPSTPASGPISIRTYVPMFK
jgi:hypothetical protein